MENLSKPRKAALSVGWFITGIGMILLAASFTTPEMVSPFAAWFFAAVGMLIVIACRWWNWFTA